MSQRIDKYIRLKQNIIKYNKWQAPYQCKMCNKQLVIEEISLDHIIPVNLLNMLSGLNISPTGFKKYHKRWWDDLQITCRRCNQLKSNKLDWKNEQTLPLLHHYVMLYSKENIDPVIEEIEMEEVELKDEQN